MAERIIPLEMNATLDDESARRARELLSIFLRQAPKLPVGDAAEAEQARKSCALAARIAFAVDELMASGFSYQSVFSGFAAPLGALLADHPREQWAGALHIVAHLAIESADAAIAHARNGGAR